MPQPQHILVIRFSAMGDAAMTVPVIKNVLQQNPQLKITVVSNAFFRPLFEGIDRCSFHPAYLKGTHKGASGMLKLYRELKAVNSFDAVADLHNVLRSKLLRVFYQLDHIKSAALDKGRAEKKALTRKDHKIFKQLTLMHERYAVVFRQLNLPVTLLNTEPVFARRSLPPQLSFIAAKGKKIIGVAPFAQHTEKMYPIEKMKNVVKTLAATGDQILLFGGGPAESSTLEQWADELESVENVAGKYTLAEELSIISNLDRMISMDSANMHLASLFAIPVISIWGATHYFAGFYGWGQDYKNIVEIDLNCRPCSVFGNKPCWRGDHACMNQLDEKQITDRAMKY